jgi:bacterioferritin-associated ferredoxin
MYVCICNAVTERDIHQAVQQGISSLEQLSEITSVSRACGCCENHASQIIEEAMLSCKGKGEK